jgi:hypothetical protein
METCSDQRKHRWRAGLPSAYTLEQADSYIAGQSQHANDGEGLHWCAADSVTNVCLGSVAVMDLRDALGTAREIGFGPTPMHGPL